MSANLKSFVENVNISLRDLWGNPINDALDACQKVRDIIKESDFYKELQASGIEELLVFKEDIEHMQFIYIRAAKDKTASLKKILRINFFINYFNEENLAAGGILTNVSCELIGIGSKVSELPIHQVIHALRYADIIGQKEILQAAIKEKEKELELLRKKLAETIAQEEAVKKQ